MGEVKRSKRMKDKTKAEIYSKKNEHEREFYLEV